MKSEWKDLRLGDVSENISRRFVFDGKEEVVFVNTGDVLEGKFLVDNYVKSEGLPGQAKKAIEPNDILFTEIRPANKRFAFVDFDSSDYVVSTKFMVIKTNDLILPRYLYLVITSNAYLREFQHVAESRSGTFPQITFDTVSYIPIRVPDLTVQRKIVQVLANIDDKIELNRKMNQTLEAMAQALFKSWFVDFDPVHAKAEAKSDAELEMKAAELGIAKEMLELFPSHLVESEMGMIPEGWEVKPFGALLSKTIGGDWGKEEPDDKHTEKVKIIRGADIPKIKNISIEAVPTRYVESKKLKMRELFDGDIVIEVSGGTKNQPTGRTLYVTNEVLEMLGNKVEPASFCRLFRPVNTEVGLILGQHMLYIYDQGKTWLYQNQSTGISNFQTTIFLEKEYVLVPDAKVLTEFYKVVRPLIEKSLSSENISLQKTRDALLPKLLSGELDVSKVTI